MNKVKLTIMGIALFVYTLAVIGLTTMIITPEPGYDRDTKLTQEEIGKMCDAREGPGF
ncbi:hypothetical protein VBD025_06115 [Virgibacillus flavescens]|uniref:hypothetical protein n=1 Tax=Virgibacillus flavescens TaxID=1611422 RepID=UPI003D338136